MSAQPYFALGLIVTKDPERHDLQLNNLRRAHRYHSELKYSSTDRYRAPFATAVIDYFLDEPDLRFSALLVDNEEHDLNHFKKHATPFHAKDVAYNWHYKKLILRSTPERSELIVCLDDRQRRKKDNLPQYLSAEFPNIKSLQLVDSKKHQLVQLADLLTGCVMGDAAGTEHKVKRAPIEHLKTRLRVPNLHHKKLEDHAKFAVDCWHPPRK